MSASLILFKEAVMVSLIADVARFGGHGERGGILLGTRRGAHFHVVDATLPMIGDRGSRFAFQRGRPEHSKIARKRWLHSLAMLSTGWANGILIHKRSPPPRALT